MSAKDKNQEIDQSQRNLVELSAFNKQPNSFVAARTASANELETSQTTLINNHQLTSNQIEDQDVQQQENGEDDQGAKASDPNLYEEERNQDERKDDIEPSWDPCQGLHFLDQQNIFDKLKETISPIDLERKQQILRNPKGDGEYITVQLIYENVHEASSKFAQETQKSPFMICDGPIGGQKHEFKKYYQWYQKLTVNKGEEWSKESIDKLVEQTCSICHKNTKEYYGCNAQQCEHIVCPLCYAQEYMRRQIIQKTQLHGTYKNYELVQDTTDKSEYKVQFAKTQVTDVPDSKEYAVIGFWDKQNKCYGQFFVNSPVIYNLQGVRYSKAEAKNKGQKFMDDPIFIFQGELGELFFFQRGFVIEGNQNRPVPKLYMTQIKGFGKNPDQVDFRTQGSKLLPLPILSSTLIDDSNEFGKQICFQLFGHKPGNKYKVDYKVQTRQQACEPDFAEQRLIVRCDQTARDKDYEEMYIRTSHVLYHTLDNAKHYKQNWSVLYIRRNDLDKNTERRKFAYFLFPDRGCHMFKWEDYEKNPNVLWNVSGENQLQIDFFDEDETIITDDKREKRLYHAKYQGQEHIGLRQSEYHAMCLSPILRGNLIGDKLLIITEEKFYYFFLHKNYYPQTRFDYSKFPFDRKLVEKTFVSEVFQTRMIPLVKEGKLYVQRGLEAPKNQEKTPVNYVKYDINIINLSDPALDQVTSAKNFKFKDQLTRFSISVPSVSAMQDYKLTEQEVEIQDFDQQKQQASFLLTLPKTRFSGSIKTWFQIEGTLQIKPEGQNLKLRQEERIKSNAEELKDDKNITICLRHQITQKSNERNKAIQYPVKAVELCSQDHHIEYPILMQASFVPKRNKIKLSNLQVNSHKVELDLGSWTFIKWVESPAIDQFKAEKHDDDFGMNDIYCLVQHQLKPQQHLMKITINHLLKCQLIGSENPELLEQIVGLKKLPSKQDNDENSRKMGQTKGETVNWNLDQYKDQDEQQIKIRIEENAFINLEEKGTKASAIKKAVLMLTDPRQKFYFLVIQTVDNIYSYKYESGTKDSKQPFEYIQNEYERYMDPTFMCYFSHKEIFYVRNDPSKRDCELRSLSYDRGGTTLINNSVMKFSGCLISMGSMSEQTDRILLVLTDEKVLYYLPIMNGQLDDSIPTVTKKYQLNQQVINQASDSWSYTILSERCIQLKTRIEDLQFFNFGDSTLQDQNANNIELFPYFCDNVDDINWTEKQQSLKRNPKDFFSFIQIKQNISSRQISILQSKIAGQIHECLGDLNAVNKNLQIYDDKVVAKTLNDLGESIYTVFNYKTSMLIGVFKTNLRLTLLSNGLNHNERIIQVEQPDGKEDPQPFTKLYQIKYKQRGTRAIAEWVMTHDDYGGVKNKVQKCLNETFEKFGFQVVTKLNEPVICSNGIPTLLWGLKPKFRSKKKTQTVAAELFKDLKQAVYNPDGQLIKLVDHFKGNFFKIVTKRFYKAVEISTKDQEKKRSGSNKIKNSRPESIHRVLPADQSDYQDDLTDICHSYLYIIDGDTFPADYEPESVVLTKNCIAWKHYMSFHFVRLTPVVQQIKDYDFFEKVQKTVRAFTANFGQKNQIFTDSDLDKLNEKFFKNAKGEMLQILPDEIATNLKKSKKKRTDQWTIEQVKNTFVDNQVKMHQIDPKLPQIQSINLSKQLLTREKDRFTLIALSKKQTKFANLENKPMQDLIQVRRNEVSCIWNLDEANGIEEICYIPNQRLKDLSAYVLNCHQQEVQDGSPDTGYGEIEFNRNMTLVSSILKDGLLEGQKAVLVRFYCELDLQMMLNYKISTEPTKITDELMLLSVINNQTFFTLFKESEYSSILEAVSKQIKSKFYEKTILKNNPLDTKEDHPVINGLFHILNMRLKINLPSVKSPTATFFNLAIDKTFESEFKSASSVSLYDKYKDNDVELMKQMKLEQNIISYSLYLDKRLFDQLLNIFLKSKQVRMGCIINTIDDMSEILKLKSKNSQELLKKACIDTSSTEKIASLTAFEQIESAVCFTRQATNDEVEIMPELKNDISKQLNGEPPTEFIAFKTQIIEVHWIDGYIKEFYQNLQWAGDESNFDNDVVITLLGQIDFFPHLFWTVFLPFCLYVGATWYYFIFVLTEAEPLQDGFVGGQPFHVFLRILITVMSGYFLFIQIVQIIALRADYFKKRDSYIQLVSIFVTQWVITEHSTHFTKVDEIRLAQVASILSIVQWYQFMFWMRLFKKTSKFLKLIVQTVLDILEFLLMIGIVLAMFSTATVILERQMVNLNHLWADEQGGEYLYTNQISTYWGNYVTDSFTQYYFNLFGTSYDAIPGNPNSVLLWIYVIVQIFFCIIVFLNMLVSIMGQTLGQVYEHADRHTLIQTTDLYTDYIGWLELIGKDQCGVFKSRYMYVAKKIIVDPDEENKVTQESIEDLNKDIKEIRARLTQSLENQVVLKENQQRMPRPA